MGLCEGISGFYVCSGRRYSARSLIWHGNGRHRGVARLTARRIGLGTGLLAQGDEVVARAARTWIGGGGGGCSGEAAPATSDGGRDVARRKLIRHGSNRAGLRMGRGGGGAVGFSILARADVGAPARMPGVEGDPAQRTATLATRWSFDEGSLSWHKRHGEQATQGAGGIGEGYVDLALFKPCRSKSGRRRRGGLSGLPAASRRGGEEDDGEVSSDKGELQAGGTC